VIGGDARLSGRGCDQQNYEFARYTQRDTALPPIDTALLIWTYAHADREYARQSCAAKMGGSYRQDFLPLIDRYAAAGRPEDVVARLAEFVAAGVRTFILCFGCSVEDVPAVRALFNAEIISELRRVRV
jgi:alkanesulfonate monooxygenase SsuD/methylene tetrahydromethanopterin reductase-like flavin-dependent oxidoreductase (luciferase family)